jgi:hypothetical protein
MHIQQDRKAKIIVLHKLYNYALYARHRCQREWLANNHYQHILKKKGYDCLRCYTNVILVRVRLARAVRNSVELLSKVRSRISRKVSLKSWFLMAKWRKGQTLHVQHNMRKRDAASECAVFQQELQARGDSFAAAAAGLANYLLKLMCLHMSLNRP